MANRPRTRSTTLSDQLRDRLSELPLSIIHDILGRVPTRDAVRMCVLSRQWRYTWTTLPHLLFKPTADADADADDDDDDDDDDGDERREKFDMSTKNFINNVLLHHQGPIHSFKLSYRCTSSIGSIENWLLCLARNDVRELSLCVSSSNPGSLKSNVYKCLKLTKLNVWDFKMSPPPSSFKGFLFLTSILLVGAELSSAGFESLVTHCPLLEYLALMPCKIEEIRIASPNLKDLCVIGCYTKLTLYAPLLDKIHVDLSMWCGLHDIQSPVCNYTNFLGSSTNLMELSGDSFFTRYLSVGLESCHPTLVFHHLKVIELEGLRFTDISEIAVVARLISDAPNLHKLYLNTNYGRADGAPDVSFKEYFRFAPSFTLEKLKEVLLSCVCDYPTGIQLVKFLLETSPVLETMELQLASSHVEKVLAEVLGFDKASPNAKITFKGIAFPTLF